MTDGYDRPQPPGPPQPGIVPLRPLQVGDLLPGAVRFVRAYPPLTVGVSAAFMIVVQLVQLTVTLAAFQPDASWPGGVVSAMIGQVGGAFVAAALNAILIGMLLVALIRAVLGQWIDPRTAWRAGAPRMVGLVGLTLLVGLVLMAIMYAALLPAFVALVSGHFYRALVLILVAYVVAVYLGVYWVLAPAAYMLEPLTVVAALRRSWRLVKGAWWRIFGILLLVGLLVAVPAIVVMIVLGGVASGPLTTDGLVRSAIATAVITMFVVPFGVGVTGLLYIDQRIRRERFDIELARWAGW